MGRFINADAFVTTGRGIIGNNMFAYCKNNPLVYSDHSGYCPYNGTLADFKRMEQGLPSLDCTCSETTAFNNTEIIMTESNDSTDHASARITVSVEKTPELTQMTPSDLSKYVKLLKKRLAYLSQTHTPLAPNQEQQLYGEIKMHIMGWDTRSFHKFDENCKEIDIDIINGIVKDPRSWVNIISSFLRPDYVR